MYISFIYAYITQSILYLNTREVPFVTSSVYLVILGQTSKLEVMVRCWQNLFESLPVRCLRIFILVFKCDAMNSVLKHRGALTFTCKSSFRIRRKTEGLV